MKVSVKVALVASIVITVVFAVFSIIEQQAMKKALYDKSQQSVVETSGVLANQISNWLNGKLKIIDLTAESINADFSDAAIQKAFDMPTLANEFDLIFGGLASDGKRITNDSSWNPTGWDARSRPWYNVAVQNNRATLTAPYNDAASGELLISVVATIRDQNTMKGAFGGDLSLETISDALNTLNFNGAGYAFLVDENNNIISHPKGDYATKSLSALFDGVTPILKPQLHEAQSEGKAVFTSFSKVARLPGANWSIGVVLNQKVVLAEATQQAWNALFITIISVLVCSIILYFAVVRLLLPLNELHGSLIDVNSGDGDLTKRLTVMSRDEFGEVSQDFNAFIGHLQSLIKSVKVTSLDIRKDTTQTATKSEMSLTQLEQQLTELEHLASAMHEMTATAQEVAQHAQSAAMNANQVDKAAEHGSDVVMQTTVAIEKLSQDMDDAVDRVNELAQYSKDIESITNVITSISAQTNLLALNAAIEAARAGEAGRGFAVVADEVRALASRTQQSTDEIQTMISQLQNGVVNAEKTIMQGKNMVGETKELADEANTSLLQIRESIHQITEMTIHIATAAEEQSSTSEEINRNTTNIRDISQKVAQGAKEQAVLCSNMMDLADLQDKNLNEFKV
ncbi:MAG: methyl-accepting chemotaxis protein [Oceanospirillaceae bacterium]